MSKITCLIYYQDDRWETNNWSHEIDQKLVDQIEKELNEDWSLKENYVYEVVMDYQRIERSFDYPGEESIEIINERKVAMLKEWCSHYTAYVADLNECCFHWKTFEDGECSYCPCCDYKEVAI